MSLSDCSDDVSFTYQLVSVNEDSDVYDSSAVERDEFPSMACQDAGVVREWPPHFVSKSDICWLVGRQTFGTSIPKK